MSTRHMYLGEGIYVKWDGEKFILETFDGLTVNNTITIHPQVMSTFVKFANMVADE